MESRGVNNTNSLAGFFEGYRKSRAFSHGYSEFIIAIAKADGLKKSPENKTDSQKDTDISDEQE
jgi:hypothetical protein